MNREQIAERRFNLLDFISSFGGKGCWWPMDKMLPILRCSKKQLRLDIDYLIKKGTIVEDRKEQGKKIVRTLYSNTISENFYPDVVRTKVYDIEPMTAFDIDHLTDGFTAEQYYGKYHYEYNVSEKRAQ